MLTRQSNIELCRLASILLVLIVHTTQSSLGCNMSLGTYLLEGFSIIGVNVFILITGYFSATPKKNSLINLAFICLFWTVVKIICRLYCCDPTTYQNLFFITSSSWFIPCYIGMLLLSPILNLFCNTVSKQVLWRVVAALLLFEFWFDWLPPRPEGGIGANYGYSVFSFCILYLLARAIRLYGLPQWFKKYSYLIYLGCSILLGITAWIGALLGYGHEISGGCFFYNNPLVVLSSVAFFMIFEQVNLQSQTINHIAKSTLAVLLGNNAIFSLYTKQFKYLFDNYNGVLLIAYWSFAIALVFCACILVDQLRLLLYKPIDHFLKHIIKKTTFFNLHYNKSYFIYPSESICIP